MAHQAVIERVRKDYPVLPLKFGTLLRCDSEMQRLIEQGHRKFAEALIRLDGAAEGAPRARVAGCLAWEEADEVLTTDTLDADLTDEKVYG